MKSYFKVAVYFGLTLVTARTVKANDPPAPIPAPLVVRVYNYAQVDRFTLNRAMEYATQIYKQSGVDLRWVVDARNDDAESGADETERKVVIVPHVNYAFRKSQSTMGFANPDPGGTAQIFYDRVCSFAAAFSSKTVFPYPAKSIMLGHAIAHEVGHLLRLPHSENGIMKATLKAGDYWLAANQALLFTPAQSGVIAEQLAARTKN